jgi:phosphohistidine phosphatase SixA
MKWPTELLLIRHAESAYNELKKAKADDREYRRFLELFKGDRANPDTLALAKVLHDRYSLGCSDRGTRITVMGEQQARLTGRGMREAGVECPDVIFISPFLRTKQTQGFMQQEWPELGKAKIYDEERIRERDHGLAILYNDWRIYQVFNPEQAKLQELLGDYDYRYVNGEDQSRT